MSLRSRSILVPGFFSALLALGGCLYGFAGGGLPDHIKTFAVRPLENLTSVAELQRELSETLRDEMKGRLGVRDAPETRAHALVRGTIQRYEADIPVGFEASNRATTTASRMVQIVVDIEVVDQVSGKTLWERKALTAEGQYQEGAELTGRRQAIQRLVTQLIEGVQSQW